MSDSDPQSQLNKDLPAYYVWPDDYERLDELGRDEFGVVYSAREKRTGAIVALKVIRFNPNNAE
jgi:serine/threonine protein kinase